MTEHQEPTTAEATPQPAPAHQSTPASQQDAAATPELASPREAQPPVLSPPILSPPILSPPILSPPKPSLPPSPRPARYRPSKRRAAKPPGSWDALNVFRFEIEEREPTWGMPVLHGSSRVPLILTCFPKLPKMVRTPGVHFFTEDYRFERLWNSAECQAAKLTAADVLLTPDFSLWRSFPRAAQLWNVYRSRWCGAYWESLGYEVIPTISWAGPDSWCFAFSALSSRGTVAVSTVGLDGIDELGRRYFVDGYAEMVRRLEPTTVLVYGGDLPPALSELAPVRQYRNEQTNGMRARAVEAGAARSTQLLLVES